MFNDATPTRTIAEAFKISSATVSRLRTRAFTRSYTLRPSAAEVVGLLTLSHKRNLNDIYQFIVEHSRDLSEAHEANRIVGHDGFVARSVAR
jgi:hypothetical protein